MSMNVAVDGSDRVENCIQDQNFANLHAQVGIRKVIDLFIIICMQILSTGKRNFMFVSLLFLEKLLHVFAAQCSRNFPRKCLMSQDQKRNERNRSNSTFKQKQKQTTAFDFFFSILSLRQTPSGHMHTRACTHKLFAQFANKTT